MSLDLVTLPHFHKILIKFGVSVTFVVVDLYCSILGIFAALVVGS